MGKLPVVVWPQLRVQNECRLQVPPYVQSQGSPLQHHFSSAKSRF